MCKSDKHIMLELRSEDATHKLGDALSKTTICRFELPLRDVFKDHPVNDAGLWNIRVAYFGLYQPQGLNNCGGIDISVDQLSSPFLFSSRRQPKHILATANADLCNDVDNDEGSAILPCGFYIGNDEAYSTTCRVAFTDWVVRITNSRDGLDENGDIDNSETTLVSEFPSDNKIVDWVLKLEISPYDPTHN